MVSQRPGGALATLFCAEGQAFRAAGPLVPELGVRLAYFGPGCPCGLPCQGAGKFKASLTPPPTQAPLNLYKFPFCTFWLKSRRQGGFPKWYLCVCSHGFKTQSRFLRNLGSSEGRLAPRWQGAGGGGGKGERPGRACGLGSGEVGWPEAKAL